MTLHFRDFQFSWQTLTPGIFNVYTDAGVPNSELTITWQALTPLNFLPSLLSTSITFTDNL